MKISVIGAGYVGLTTAACLAQIGHDVFCSESEQDKLRKLQNGVVPIFEPGVDTIVAETMRNRHLLFGSTIEAIERAQIIFICVGTPPLPNGDADLSAIESLARTMAQRANGFKLVVEKSTVPVQTASQLRRHLSNHGALRAEFDVASNPEFLREGSAVHDFLHPDRIVIGVESQHAEQILRDLYAPIVDQRFTCPIHSSCPARNGVPLLVTDTNSAELIKHASNSFLAMKISFINMMADLCEAAGADIGKVAEGIGLDPRIGPSFLHPGIGFGGFCFPKDVQAIVRIAERFGCEFDLLREVEQINRSRIDRFVAKIRSELWVLRGKKICVWGLAFKPNTDDIRFAPALAIIRQLQSEGAFVQAYDPQAIDNTRKELPEVRYCDDAYAAAAGADAVILLTEWPEFRELDFARVAGMMERPLIIDGRNALSPGDLSTHGFEYVGVGGVRRSKTVHQSIVSREHLLEQIPTNSSI
jgi:UDPglucose 6-dehydrogenase